MAIDTPRDIKLSTSGDWDVTTGDLELTQGTDAIKQSVRIHLEFFQGEWFLDLDAGIPYYQSIMVKNPNPNLLQSVFRSALDETPGVASVDELNLSIDTAARQLSVEAHITGDYGEFDINEVL